MGLKRKGERKKSGNREKRQMETEMLNLRKRKKTFKEKSKRSEYK